jgi:hypothetical protein
LNKDTVWTWNAIGKRKGAWALDEDASEATKGFLLNHLIHELLPPKADGMRWANSDPITGQAAWFDLRVKIEKTAAPAESQPVIPAIKSPVGKGPKDQAWKVGK